MRLDHGLGSIGSERADELILEILDADVEPELLHAGAGEARAESRALERTPEVALLAGVAETREPDAEPLRAEHAEEASDRLRTAHRHDGNAFGSEITAANPRERLDRTLIADAFDEHDRARHERVVRHAERGLDGSEGFHRSRIVTAGDSPAGGHSPSRTVSTTFPVFCPVSTYRDASTTSSSG